MSRAAESRRKRVDAWIERGGVILAATDRAARALLREFDRTRQNEGKTAWATPWIFGWDAWVCEQWSERNSRGLVLLNTQQERAVWGAVIRANAAVLHPGRLADAAARAARLLAEFAPGSLAASNRAGWGEDAEVFSEWLREFDAVCRRDGLVSASRLALDLTGALESEPRPPVLLIGFDRLLETQRVLLDAWGRWEMDAVGARAGDAAYRVVSDSAAEVEACVQWLRRRVAAHPEARWMVVTPGLAERRGELERALLAAGLGFEFSLGVPLGRVGVVRAALLLQRWLREPLAEAELDWWIGSGFCVASAEEAVELAEVMRAVRRHGRERPEWALEDFVAEVVGAEQPSGAKAPNTSSDSMYGLKPVPSIQSSLFSNGETKTVKLAEAKLAAWTERMVAARELLAAAAGRQAPMEWVGLVEQLLAAVAWPGYRPLGSAAFQARKRWERVLEECGSLGFDGARMEWGDFVAALGEAVAGTIFAAESGDAPVLITEPVAAAGQLADGIWFLGATEESWPGRGQVNPLLPVGLQRDAGMPHASSQADWELAEVATERLLASADEVIFGYARLGNEIEARASRLVARYLGAPVELEIESAQETPVLAVAFEDTSRVPYGGATLRGGAGALTRQSVCAFQAFGTTRLAADDWELAETGLNARQRGQLLHGVLHRVWAGRSEGGISTLDDLLGVADLRVFVAGYVRAAMAEEFDPENRNAIPARFGERFLALEAERLTRLVSEWLEYERRRLPFRVEGVEVSKEVTVAGLTLQLRLDRVDVLPDGSRLVVDYKGGKVGPKAWSGERPDDVQLPLYATFAVEGDLEGLVFGRVRPGEVGFAGRVRGAQGSLIAGLSPRNGLMRDPLTTDQLDDWRVLIEQLGRDFVEGRAEVAPKDLGKTCERCALHAVCRIYENQTVAALGASVDESGDEGEAADD